MLVVADNEHAALPHFSPFISNIYINLQSIFINQCSMEVAMKYYPVPKCQRLSSPDPFPTMPLSIPMPSSAMELSCAQRLSLRGAMVVASGDGKGNGNGDNGGAGDSDARRRIAEVGKCNARSRIAEVGQCDARSRIAEAGRCDAMVACEGDVAGVCAVDNVAPIQPLQSSPVLGLRCWPNRGTSLAGLIRKYGGSRGSVVSNEQRICVPLPSRSCWHGS